jgi:hypothetical protein
MISPMPRIAGGEAMSRLVKPQAIPLELAPAVD